MTPAGPGLRPETGRPTTLTGCTHGKPETVPEAALSEGPVPAPHGPAAPAQEHDRHCSGPCRGLVRGGPGLGPARPGHLLTRQSSSGTLGGGQGEEQPHFPCLICEDKVSNKRGVGNPQLSWEEKTSPPSLQAGKPAGSAVPTPGRPRAPPLRAPAKDRTAGTHAPTCRSRQPSKGRAGMGFRTSPSDTPLYRMEKPRLREAGTLPIPDSRQDRVGATRIANSPGLLGA